MIDIGLNLTSSQFRHDIDAIVNDAKKAGVDTMIITGTSIDGSSAAYNLAQQYPGVLYATAGIHPHNAKLFSCTSMAQLQQLLQQDKVLAVGECGLDFNRNFSPRSEELSCFEAQLELAVAVKMPVFLHQRDALGDFLRLIRKYRSGLVGAVAHCFTGGQAELESCLEEGLHIGITGWLCDERRGKALQDCVAMIPDDKVMVETDAPYLFPRDLKIPKEESLTGKQKKKITSRNEPKYLPHIVRTLARLMNKDEQELARLTTENARRFFQLG